jgi:nicotinate-nucleotide adenylyltransferase
MAIAKSIGILGGTFDPIHFGHLRIALQLLEVISLNEIRFIPCQQPVHKSSPLANTEQRIHMLELALAKQTGFILDTRETLRATPSFTLETIQSLHEDFPDASLNLIIGSDEFCIFNTWYNWQTIMSLANLIVILRPECPLPQAGQMAELLNSYQVPKLSFNAPQQIYVPMLLPLTVASSHIRQICKNGLSPRYLLPDLVYFYLQKHQIYA